KKQYGNKMYGKKLGLYATDVLGKNKYTFFIAEKYEDTAENKEQRRKRKLFFLRNGFIDTGIEYEMYGVNFDVYVKKGTPPESFKVDKRYIDTVMEVYYH
ncbi:MAG: hypothetical protein J6Z11_02620, partial [Candidatus Riflebacteria bacterium]|nr:hypothetical protein [Candidatus Riflebacteria bacterium]